MHDNNSRCKRRRRRSATATTRGKMCINKRERRERQGKK
jgi:hypothetical protein